MPMDFDILSIVLGGLATLLFAECIILFIKGHSLKNKMDAEVEGIRYEEKLKYEKKEAELQIHLKAQELELKSDYEDLLAAARQAKREIEDKLSEAKINSDRAQRASEMREQEFTRFARMKEDYSIKMQEYVAKLTSLSSLSVEEIRQIAKIEIEKKCVLDLQDYRNEILSAGIRDIEEESKGILINAMQRISAKLTQEITTCIVKIPDEAMKGRLIGKEGRNIRSFEAATGTTLLIDETPDSVMISCFDPARREVAKIALENLVKDGRVNPVSIEECVKDAQENIKDLTYKWGCDAVEALNLSRVNPDIVELVGKLNLHLSLNQNSLEHSVEVAKLAGLIAAELNCDVNLAKRAGLFHDIGKACVNDDESHSKAGARVLRAANENEILVNAVEAHHNEVDKLDIYATIVQMADTISATRPGARMDASDGYIQRIKTLEQSALAFEGVANAYVIQAGKELRVVVLPDVINDLDATELLKKIRLKIEESLDTSIPVKITLIREQRFSTQTTKS